MNNRYDFYGYGVKVAAKSNKEIEKIANEISEKYGEDAKEEFEIGIAATISVNAHYDRDAAVREMVDNYNNKYHADLKNKNTSVYDRLKTIDASVLTEEQQQELKSMEKFFNAIKPAEDEVSKTI